MHRRGHARTLTALALSGALTLAGCQANAPDSDSAGAREAPVAASSTAGDAPAPAVDLASGNPEMGKFVFNRCVACHTTDKSAASGIGPNLHGVVGRKRAARTDYTYSPAMVGKGGVWDAAALDLYLTSPRDAVVGNKMAFIGIPDAGDRANLIAWLATQGD